MADYEFDFLLNPTSNHVLAMLGRSTNDRVTGLVVGTSLYWWDTPDDRGIYTFGFDNMVGGLDMRMSLQRRPPSELAVFACRDERVLLHPQVQTLLRTSRIGFPVVGLGNLNFEQYCRFSTGQRDWRSA